MEAKGEEPESILLLREIQRDVRWRWREAFKYPLHKEWEGSDPKPAFNAENVFTGDNWNDARVNLFRAFFAGWFHGGLSNGMAFIGSLVITHRLSDDQNYVFIQNLRTSETFFSTWYKSRGCTESITRNGKLITLPELQELLREMLADEVRAPESDS